MDQRKGFQSAMHKEDNKEAVESKRTKENDFKTKGTQKKK